MRFEARPMTERSGIWAKRGGRFVMKWRDRSLVFATAAFRASDCNSAFGSLAVSYCLIGQMPILLAHTLPYANL